MIGSNGPRMLRIALPHVDAWNTWYEDYGNTAEGFAALNARISDAARARRPRAGGDHAQRLRVRRPRPRRGERRVSDEAPPIEGSADPIAARIRELGEAGADEVILVVSPINERVDSHAGRRC